MSGQKKGGSDGRSAGGGGYTKRGKPRPVGRPSRSALAAAAAARWAG